MDPTLASALIAQGLQHHRAGRLDKAEALYRQALTMDADALEGWRLLGVLAQQRGAFKASAEIIGRALAIRREATDLSNLANAYNQLGRHAEAVDVCAEAVALDPQLAAAHSNRGVAERALGRLADAAASFKAAVALQPRSTEAQANLGVTLTELGRPAEAEAALQIAVGLAPEGAEAWFNLGNARLRQLKLDSAREAFQQALALRPAYPDAHANLAATYKALAQPELAVAHYGQAAMLAPRDVKILHNHALMLASVRRFADAVPVYEQALAIDPGDAHLHTNLGSALQEDARGRHDVSVLAVLDKAIFAHLAALAIEPRHYVAQSNLGLALLARGMLNEAVGAFQAAIEMQPEIAESYSNLGQCLSDLGRLDEAAAACRQAIALKPTLAEAHSTLGNILIAQQRLAEAEPVYHAALALKPEMAGAWCNLGVALFRQGRTAEGEHAYAQALKFAPDLPDARWNQALVLLQQGRLEEGFAEYEWRLKRPGRIREDARFTQPLWDGRELNGATILVHAEQGFGDAIQCARFLPRVQARNARVALLARAPLKRLLEHAAGVDAFVTEGERWPNAACRAPLFSLPSHFVRGEADLAVPMPYLPVDPALASGWAARLPPKPEGGLRIGIVWSGNVTSEVEQGRSIPLSAFSALAGPKVRLVSLQKGYGLEQLAEPAPGFEVADLGPAYADGDFADTAAIMANLDLVVSCDTAAAHLAGAIGVDVWLAVSTVADWRWMERRTDSPWYPTLKLFRQATRGDWTELFARMAAELPV